MPPPTVPLLEGRKWITDFSVWTDDELVVFLEEEGLDPYYTVETYKAAAIEKSEKSKAVGVKVGNSATRVIMREQEGREFCVSAGFGVFRDEAGNEIAQQRYNGQGHPVDEQEKPYSRTNPKPKTKRHYDGLTIHELRHTVATHLVSSGVDFLTVKEILGHASITTTVNVYGHALESSKRAAIDNAVF
jgi:site-specific recombinase XerC